jgi:hypothetical protein
MGGHVERVDVSLSLRKWWKLAYHPQDGVVRGPRPAQRIVLRWCIICTNSPEKSVSQNSCSVSGPAGVKVLPQD